MPVFDYLPNSKSLHKVPRSFILDIIRYLHCKKLLYRTLDSAGFDEFVRRTMAARQARIIEKTNKAVEILPIFGEKLQTTNLYSSNFTNATSYSEKGPRALHLKEVCKAT